MPLLSDPVSSVATTVGIGLNFLGGILERADRDGPDNELHENLTTLQNGFANGVTDSKSFRLFVDKLFNDAGFPLTPTGDVDMGRRELVHHAFVCLAHLIHERKLVSRLLAKQVKV